MVLDETMKNPNPGFEADALPQAVMIPLDVDPQLALMPLFDDYSSGEQTENLPFLFFDSDDVDEDDMSDDESFDDMDDDFDDDFDDDDDFEDDDDDYDDEDDDFDYEEDVDYDDFDE